MEYIEYEFEVKNLDIQIQQLEAEIAAMQLQKDRINYEKVKLAGAYNAYLNMNQVIPTYKDSIETSITDVSEEQGEVKTRRLRKND